MEVSLSTYNVTKQNIVFDFSENDYFEINLCCPLGVLIDELKDRKNKVVLIGINDAAERAFKKNGFEVVYSNIKVATSTDEVIQYRTFKLDDTLAFQEYVNNNLLNHVDFPKMSQLLRNKIIRSITEIFNNAHNHGQCEKLHTCGHYFHTEKMLKFTMTDMGVTIRKKVNDFFNAGSTMTGVQTIKWAVKSGNTTNRGNIPGGLGYHLIREFLRLNGGQIQIVSSDGFWQEDGGKVFEQTFPGRFLGTIVNLGFNLADPNSYILQEEINLENIL